MNDWLMRMNWNDVCFLHWRVAPEVLRPTLASGLELDLYDGSAWLSIVPFRMTEIRRRGVPRLPGFADVPEINVRTYVRAGGSAAVWFYSLDAAGLLAVEGARLLMGLPYFNASIVATMADGAYAYRSERHDRRASAGRFAATWRLSGDAAVAQAGSIEAFLHERYELAVSRGGRLFAARVMHAPWRFHPIDVTIVENTLASIPGLVLTGRPDYAFFASPVLVRTTGLRGVPAVRQASLQ